SVDAGRTPVATGDASCSSGCYGLVRIWRLRGGTMREVGGRYVQNTSPSLSAGGSRIAFSRTLCERATGRCERPAGIWVASVRSGRLTRITRTGYCPDWSRDGRAIVYVDNVDGSLRVVPAVGGRSIRLLRDIGGCNLSSPPAWSPDARTIAAVDSHAGGLRVVDARQRRWHA